MRKLLWTALILALITANAGVAGAHNWWFWTWGRADMNVYEFTAFVAEAEAARRDWAFPQTRVSLALVPKHSDISLISGDYGKTQWWGLATVESWSSYWPWICGGNKACRFLHAHARYNSAGGGKRGTGDRSDIRGVFCQELGHTLGLDHSPMHDCMGKRYFKDNDVNVVGPHARADVNARY